MSVGIWNLYFFTICLESDGVVKVQSSINKFNNTVTVKKWDLSWVGDACS
jgi:hypothetical protein